MSDQEPRPRGFEEQARRRFSQIPTSEVTVEQHIEIETREFQRQRQLEGDPSRAYQPGLRGMTPCGNGDFEGDIATTTEWQGGYGSVLSAGPVIPVPPPHPFTTFTAGIYSGSSNSFNAHQTWVATGPDPNVPISTTAPGSSQHAVRIGNAVNGSGCELLSKTFTVTAAQRDIRFWYALVFEDPGHDPPHQPFFWVRVSDSADNEIPGAVNLGNGTGMLVAASANPFFQKKPGTIVLYKDWSCARIDLSNHVGQQVTVEFVTGDCGYGGHYGYAYVDNFCGDCARSPEGNITYDAAASSHCGPGTLCFDYSLPKDPSGGTGSITISLDIYQSGVLLTTMVSPTLASGSSYCFSIVPLSIPGIDPNLGGFDFVATGAFAIGSTTLAPLTVGTAPDGARVGQNNDYEIKCKSFSYAVKFVCGVAPECACACGPVRPGSYATEINIYNHNAERVAIRKHVVPVVFAGAPAGREPRVVGRRAEDAIVLPPHSATMDDCCRLAELLLGAPPQGPMPLTVGFLEIVSPVELSVTAVYTASSPNGSSISIDVDQIVPRIVLV